jgi:hypothetical protein
MYVTYAFTVAIFVAVLLVLWNFAGNPPVWVYLITMIILAGGTAPLQVRYSRAVMLYAFSDVRFDSTYYYGPPREPEAQDDTSDQLDAAEIQRAYQGYIEDSEQQQQ